MRLKNFIPLLAAILIMIAFAGCRLKEIPDVIEPIKASFSIGSITNNSIAPATVDFNNLSDNADSYKWEFGDGDSSFSENPSHTYFSGGEYKVTLTAIHPQRGTDDATITINIQAGPILKANFSIDSISNSSFAPAIVYFKNLSENADSCQWNFGDPSSGAANLSNEKNPTHTYLSADSFTITLTVFNNVGESDSAVISVDIQDQFTPIAGFVIDSITTLSYAPSTYFFRSTSVNADKFTWDFGDPSSGNNNVSYEESPSHFYKVPSQYTVQLTVENTSSGQTRTTSKTFNVYEVKGFEKTFTGTIGDDGGKSIIQTPNRDFAITGFTTDGGDVDLWLILTDKDGTPKPGNPISFGSSSGQDEGASIILTQGGGFAMTGHTHNASTDFDLWLLQTDSDGNILSSKSNSFDGGNQNKRKDYGFSITETQSGGFAMTGYTPTGSNGSDNAVWLVITNANGDLQGTPKIFDSGNGHSRGHSIIETQNGNLAIIGYTDNGTNDDVYFVSTDANGNALPGSGKKYNGAANGNDKGHQVIKTSDNRLAIVGETFNGVDMDVWLIFTDLNGIQLGSSKLYGGADHQRGYAITETFSGGFAITGETCSGSDCDLLLILTDSLGNQISGFPKSFGGSGNDKGYSIIQSQNGGLVMVGTTSVLGVSDLYFIQTDIHGNIN